jgi:hypothetical protein
METQRGENHKIIFVYYVKITFIGNTNFQYSPTPTGRRPQTPSFTISNQKEDPTP